MIREKINSTTWQPLWKHWLHLCRFYYSKIKLRQQRRALGTFLCVWPFPKDLHRCSMNKTNKFEKYYELSKKKKKSNLEVVIKAFSRSCSLFQLFVVAVSLGYGTSLLRAKYACNTWSFQMKTTLIRKNEIFKMISWVLLKQNTLQNTNNSKKVIAITSH